MELCVLLWQHVELCILLWQHVELCVLLWQHTIGLYYCVSKQLCYYCDSTLSCVYYCDHMELCTLDCTVHASVANDWWLRFDGNLEVVVSTNANGCVEHKLGGHVRDILYSFVHIWWECICFDGEPEFASYCKLVTSQMLVGGLCLLILVDFTAVSILYCQLVRWIVDLSVIYHRRFNHLHLIWSS